MNKHLCPVLTCHFYSINPNFATSKAMSMISKEPDVLTKGNIVVFPTQYSVARLLVDLVEERKTISESQCACTE